MTDEKKTDQNDDDTTDNDDIDDDGIDDGSAGAAEDDAAGDDDKKSEFVPRADFDLLYKESKQRKEKNKKLRQQLKDVESNKQQKADDDESNEKYKGLYEQTQQENTRLRHLGKVTRLIEKLGAVSARVGELAFEDAKDAGVLDDDEDLKDFIEEWHSDNESLFQAKKTVATTHVQTKEIPNMKSRTSPEASDVRTSPHNSLDQTLNELIKEHYGK